MILYVQRRRLNRKPVECLLFKIKIDTHTHTDFKVDSLACTKHRTAISKICYLLNNIPFMILQSAVYLIEQWFNLFAGNRTDDD